MIVLIITNFLLILTVKKCEDYTIFDEIKAYEKIVRYFWATLHAIPLTVTSPMFLKSKFRFWYTGIPECLA